MSTYHPHLIWSLLKSSLRLNRHGIYKSRDFHTLLERERALADRHDRAFCLLEFSMARAKAAAPDPKPLLEVLTRRLRSSDIAGWTGPLRIGVILPDTPAKGAWTLAERVCRELDGRMPTPACHVCTYPSDWTPKESLPESGRVSEAPAVPPEPVNGMVPDLVGNLLLGRPPFWKRSLDMTGAGVAILALSPLMAVIALTIKLVSRGPVLFRQERIGYMGKPFVCWKFRTMKVDADTRVHQDHFRILMRENVKMAKLDTRDDARLIPLGRYLRAAGVDELPQLFNVVLGEMSLVGPRPCIRYEFEDYQRWQRKRCDTLPGLTGLWQTSGKNRTTFVEMIRLDISYTQRKSLWFDLLMLGKTVPTIVSEIRAVLQAGRRR